MTDRTERPDNRMTRFDELDDKALDLVSGGPIYIKIKGVDGDVNPNSRSRKHSDDDFETVFKSQ